MRSNAVLMRLKPPKIIRRLLPDLIWEIDDPEGVFLTFDDGPTPGITEWILSTLDKYDAKATFFVPVSYTHLTLPTN